MLELRNITKKYQTGDLIQKALDGVSLTLRDSEFVCVLGPSGSGKTTLLNIIGGLDHCDEGELRIDGVSTGAYRDRDWDTYRNHRIGFVFQSYNLIPHQTILSNIELALTIAGVSPGERRRRAKQALADVGLAGQEHKRPNQMSGGQMQRVAIARALVNDPDILLADEPTGALDTETSIQVMDLLRQVARERLVVMVTHNADLADAYATRVVKLRDGRIEDDSDPCEARETEEKKPEKGRKARMSFLTSLKLSAQNLRTKKGRTVLTALAGSIGIIGIALILAMSSSVNRYIEDIQKETMSSYPITITSQAMDLTVLMQNDDSSFASIANRAERGAPEEIRADFSALQVQNTLTGSVKENDLAAFKRYLEKPDCELLKHVGENGIQYVYSVPFEVYAFDRDGKPVNTNADPSELLTESPFGTGAYNWGAFSALFGSSGNTGADNFSELMPGTDGQAVNQVIRDSYDLVWGRWPEAADELILTLNYRDVLSVRTLYQLGFITGQEYVDMAHAIEETGETPELSWSYDELAERKLVVIPASARYEEQADGTFRMIGETDEELQRLTAGGIPVRIVGVVRQNDRIAGTTILTRLAYTTLLTKQLMELGDNNPAVNAQRANPGVNVLTGLNFEIRDRDAQLEAAREYLSTQLTMSDMLMLYESMPDAFSRVDFSEVMKIIGMGNMDTKAIVSGFVRGNLDDDTLLRLYEQFIATETFEGNLEAFGYVDPETPASISIYADTFEAKDAIAAAIKRYNESAPESEQITYTDYIALITSSVTTIVDVISYVLIAFVAVSLVVSCIMIGIITHISVLERTKEIGILRALGASKRNITQVFNAETVIIGFCAGVMGVAIAMLLTIPINAILQHIIGSVELTVTLPLTSALILVAISVIITAIGGVIPARKAASRDPVVALRTE